MLPSGRRDTSVSEDTPPDWGGDGDDSDNNTEVELPAQWKAEDVTEDQWPWGPAGRPSDRGEGAGHMAQRPNEPVGEPPQWRNQLGALKPNEPEGEPGPIPYDKSDR